MTRPAPSATLDNVFIDDDIGCLEDGLIGNTDKEKFYSHSNREIQHNKSLDTRLPFFSMCMSFLLSTNEEHTRIHFHLVDKCFDLGERGHHYLLATLARKRLADYSTGMDSTAQGWLERTEVSKMLGLDVQHLNIHIYRIRQQILKLAPAHGKTIEIIEKRRGGIRLADLSFKIYRGSCIEGQYTA